MRLLIILTAAIVGMAVASPDPALLLEAFKHVFPLKDGSEILVRDSAFELEALHHIELLGVSSNTSDFCALDETTVLTILMKASLGNLLMATSESQDTQPYQANPITGKLEFVDSYDSNRLLVFQVLVFSLLLGIARSWLLLHRAEALSRE